MTADFPFKNETAFQIAVAILFRSELPLNVVWFAVPNGEWRDPATARKLKEMGVRPGVADFLLFRRDYRIALELKTPAGRLSDDQKGFRAKWIDNGGNYEVARSLDEVRAVIARYDLLGLP